MHRVLGRGCFLHSQKCGVLTKAVHRHEGSAFCLSPVSCPVLDGLHDWGSLMCVLTGLRSATAPCYCPAQSCLGLGRTWSGRVLVLRCLHAAQSRTQSNTSVGNDQPHSIRSGSSRHLSQVHHPGALQQGPLKLRCCCGDQGLQSYEQLRTKPARCSPHGAKHAAGMAQRCAHT